MGAAARKQQKISGLQQDLPIGAEADDAASLEDKMERQYALPGGVMIDVKRAFETAANFERWPQARKFDKAAECIHETISLRDECLEHSTYR
jgi:hypothetical protein